MEVKLFVHKSTSEAEAALNEWLKQENVFIEYIGQSQSEHGGRFVFVVSVFYSDKPVARSLKKDLLKPFSDPWLK